MQISIKQLVIKLLIIIMLMSAGVSQTNASGDVIVSLRFYEGSRGAEQQNSSVVTSFQLRPLFVGNIISQKWLKEEQEELKRIFNLTGLKVITSKDFAWKGEIPGKSSRTLARLFIINGHEFNVTLVRGIKTDNFSVRVEIKTDEGFKELLNTDMELPESKGTVLGFEDSLQKPYFLSLHRQQDDAVLRDDFAKDITLDRPKLLKQVKPVYPEVALKSGVQGDVILETTTDEEGKVILVKVLSGHPLLRMAALKTVKEWEYEPFMVKGKPHRAKFTVAVEFRLPGSKSLDESGSINPRENAPDIFPTRGYLTDGFGERIHPFTKKKNFHIGIDIAAPMGNDVIAPANGKVILAEYIKYRGNTLKIDHGNGYVTVYGQLKDFAVKVGEEVKKNQVIAHVGSSGRSTASHLHWEVHLDGKPVNPMLVVKKGA